MPVRVRAIPPGEFIRNHLRDVGGVDYVQSIHRAYKAYLRAQGLRNGTSRETMSKYIWLCNKLGLIVFDHAEAPAYWDAVADGVRVTRAYRRQSRPLAPSPRHYYRLVDETDPRWTRLEASYRQSIGIEVPPPFPRVPWAPMPVEYPIPPEEIAAPPPPAPPAPPKLRKAKKVKAPKVKKPTPAETAAEAVAPFEARIKKVVDALGQLDRTPDTALANAIEEELIGMGEDVLEVLEGKRGLVRGRLVGVSTALRHALENYALVKSSLTGMLRETLPARRATQESAFHAAIRVVTQDLIGE
jgi:hypothetical protein